MFLATQSLEADLLIPFKFRCQKIMLVGDPKQLSPTVISEAGKAYKLDQSLYCRLYSIFERHNSPNSPITMLTTQYRMHSEICQFPNEYFYGNRLTTPRLVDIRVAHFPLKPLFFYDLMRSQHEIHHTRSSFNMDEVSCIGRFCTLLATDGKICRSLIAGVTPTPPTEAHQGPIALNDKRSIRIQERIAVITPYQAQVDYLRAQLPPHIEVMTADSSQGSEKDIVIISCVRGKDSIGFLYEQSRLNVILTRARYGLYVFGNLTWLSQQDDMWNALFWNAHKRGLLLAADESNVALPRLV